MIERVLFIDESGTGTSNYRRVGTGVGSVGSAWVAAGVLVEWSRLAEVTKRVDMVLASCLRAGLTELKGATLGNELRPGVGETDVLDRLGSIVTDTGSSVWLAGCVPYCKAHPRYPTARADPSAIARHILVDRVNGMARSAHFEPNTWLIVHDISSAGDLANLGKTVAAFEDVIAQHVRSEVIYPEVVGGRSERWAPIQIADVFAFYGRHALGVVRGLSGARLAKADLFMEHLYPRLKKASTDRTVGWAIWPAGKGVSNRVLRDPTYEQLRRYVKLA